MPKKERVTKTAAKSKHTTAQTKKRQITSPTYKSFRLSKRIQHKNPKITGSFRLAKQAILVIFRRKRVFVGIIFAYLLLTMILVKGFGFGANISELRDSINEVYKGDISNFFTSLTLFTTLLGSIGTGNGDQSSAYQSMLLIITSLAIIWALRQTLGHQAKKHKFTAIDAFYEGMHPLVKFLIVLLVMGLELLPLALVNFLYGSVFTAGLAITMPEKVLWGIILLLLGLLSLYMVTSSIFALYIVTLPEVRPMQALRSARELVRFRRWTIIRKILFLPVSMLVVSGIITIPIIMLAPSVAEWVFFIMSMFGLAFLHSYLYSLYRELL